MMRFFVFLAAILIAVTAPVLLRAQDVSVRSDRPDLTYFSQWPVLHEGRVKPMESFARAVLYQISGDTSLHGISATEWLVNSLFDPSSTIAAPFIKVRPLVILDLPEREDRLYSMTEVMQALTPHQDTILALESKPMDSLTADQKQLMDVYAAVTLYNQVIQSFSAVLPLNGQKKTFLQGGGTDPQRQLIAAGGLGNGLVRFIPHDNPSQPYLSLWQAMDMGTAGQEIIPMIQSMAAAWNESRYDDWTTTSQQVQVSLDPDHRLGLSFRLEHLYVMLQPMVWVMGFYAAAIVLMMFSRTARSGVMLGAGGFMLHGFALIVRSVILSRPPTGTLYETLLFGSALIAAAGVWMAWHSVRKNPVKGKAGSLPIVSIAAALLLLFVSRGFIQGDSLNVLVAVLNTNFWLSTHVTCITVGYGFCILASVCAHIALIEDDRKNQAQVLLLPMALTAVLFTAVGTLLGGIWADQSWGRFWGWDPKENGALLIVLWLVWVLHGRLSGHLKGRAFAAAMAGTTIMVALTWFGVNLLGVGLHSYGFISGIAWGLFTFILLQMVLIAVLYYRPWRRRMHA